MKNMLLFALFIGSINAFSQQSELPVIFITCADSIVDEPKVPATFRMIESNGNSISENIGIETRGGSSQVLYTKQSYRIGFKDTEGNNKDVSLLGLRSDDDWDLRATPSDILRINEKTANEIWQRLNHLHYQSLEPAAINCRRGKYAELFLNGDYMGVYQVTEPVDRKQLKLKKFNETKGGIRGELFKSNGWGLANYRVCPPYVDNSYIWDGGGGNFESVYPKNVYPEWKDLYDFVHCVVHDYDNQFYTNWKNYFDEENAIDYFIYLNLASANDNYSNNLYIARYDIGYKYFYIPRDYDGAFGQNWNMTKDTVLDNILVNGMYERLLKDNSEGCFVQKMHKRWQELRNTWMTVEGIMEMFHYNYDYLLENGVYEREEQRWVNIENPRSEYDRWHFDNQYIDYMADWLAKRIDFLDNEFNYTTGIEKIDSRSMSCPCVANIYNLTGSLVRTIHSLNPPDKELFANLQRGVYIVIIKSIHSNEIQREKVIVR
ncbi:MAG: CotH kinase family protein [Dysgonamonadaceae bacterium]|jgi:hypothetical protein|nr:CotH kinase family protein [Dysgonamonadaceae bacterium]